MRGQSKKLAQVARLQARGQLHIPQPGEDLDETPEFDDALAAFGLQPIMDGGDNPEPVQDYCYLWPCNVAVFNLWQRLQTQWRVGADGPTGLDYTAVIAYLQDVARVRRKDFDEVFAHVQAMENATLLEWQEQRRSNS